MFIKHNDTYNNFIKAFTDEVMLYSCDFSLKCIFTISQY